MLLGGLSSAKIDAADIPYSILHSFEVAERYPSAPPVSDGHGNLYGTTGGGLSNGGTVFTIRSDGTGFRRIHDFVGGENDGFDPDAALILDGLGNVYGTTAGDGGSNAGNVFTMRVDGGGFRVLHSFVGGPNDGFFPFAPLTLDGAGNLYGTTISGGTLDFGTVFKLRADGSGFQLLHSFGDDPNYEGSSQSALLLDGSGNLYGTTAAGGWPDPGPGGVQGGWGSVFRLKTDGTGFQVLRTFSAGSSGEGIPSGSLVSDTSGKLYGMTAFGAASGCGTVFSLGKDGSGFQILRMLAGGSNDGCNPAGSLLTDQLGNLYGMTFGSASGIGGLSVIFKVRTDATGYQILHTFVDRSEGVTLNGSLVLDGSGTLYGTMFSGGGSNAGTIFSLRTDGTLFQVLDSFAGTSGDGGSPSASVVADGSGFVYGTTTGGGVADEGTVFRVRSDGTGFQILHAFADASEAAKPEASLVLDRAGNLYGTTHEGGPSNGGIVFKVRTDGTGFEVLHTFVGGAGDGFGSVSALILDGVGNLYGATSYGGPSGAGNIYAMRTDGSAFHVLHDFTFPTSQSASLDGYLPERSLLLDGSGNLYGVATYGGSSNLGTVFRMKTDGSDFEVLHSFSGGAGDGAIPSSSLILDAFGNLYGTTAGGGSASAGTVFKIATSKISPQRFSFQLLHSFDADSSDELTREYSVIQDGFGNLYGTTSSGGPSGAGTVFTMRMDGTSFRTMHAFGDEAGDGRDPRASLFLDGAGHLYGTTAGGGAGTFGTVFVLSLGRIHPVSPSGPFLPAHKLDGN